MSNQESIFPVYSNKLANFFIPSLLLEVVVWVYALVHFILAYIAAFQDNYDPIYEWFNLRSNLVEYSLIWLVIRLFMVAWHWFLVTTDLKNRFPDEQIKPGLNLIWVFVPIANIVMYGYNQIIQFNHLDSKFEQHNNFAKWSLKLKVALGLFYAGALGTIFTIPQTITFPENIQAQMMIETIIFTAIQFLFIMLWLIGIALLLHRWKKLFSVTDSLLNKSNWN